MHWVVQENLFHESGLEELVRVLERMSLPYSLHKVVPFSGDLIPDIDPPNPVVAFGAYSMINVAKRRGWLPGVWSNENFDFAVWSQKWGTLCLNADARIGSFGEAPVVSGETFFMRPTEDSKAFAGDIFEWDEYDQWRHRVIELGEQDGSTLTAATKVMVASPKAILREYRLWIVDHRVVTASQYKLGYRVVYDQNVDDEVIWFGTDVVNVAWPSLNQVDTPLTPWVPDRAFVLDVALTPEGYRIIEINSLNAAGLYAANVGRLVEALEGMGYDRSNR